MSVSRAGFLPTASSVLIRSDSLWLRCALPVALQEDIRCGMRHTPNIFVAHLDSPGSLTQCRRRWHRPRRTTDDCRLRKAVGSVIFSNYWRPVARRTARRGRPGRRTSVRLCVWKGLNSEVRQFLGNFSVLALWGLASYPSPSKSLRSSAPPNRQLGAKMQGTF